MTKLLQTFLYFIIVLTWITDWHWWWKAISYHTIFHSSPSSVPEGFWKRLLNCITYCGYMLCQDSFSFYLVWQKSLSFNIKCISITYSKGLSLGVRLIRNMLPSSPHLPVQIPWVHLFEQAAPRLIATSGSGSFSIHSSDGLIACPRAPDK